ncbi:hypothetical protein ABH930_006221 [Kitasatospora sp. GAS204A]|uniref:hypothetical protein n=1 Tax=unclassified Kitasatospora TaxID=2633591 RepID=UPI0024737612|nr:hypothetical protein [Kitasatospora sp. GAS204B]MDH6120259.1 hypothetical protein [Kitasatospora sp. GAS204B]
MSDTHPISPPTPAEIRRTGLVLSAGTWILIIAVCTFSAMTGTQFIGAHSPWHWSGWILATSIDVAFVMSLQTDATLARYGVRSGHWPAAFRLLTGAFSVFVNIGDAALHHDPVGIVVHLIAPALLLVLGEAGPAWQLQLVNLRQGAHPMSASSTTPDDRGAHLIPEVRTPETDPPADAEEARSRILQGRLDGLSQRETARWAHRSPTFVRKLWNTMDDDLSGLP